MVGSEPISSTAPVRAATSSGVARAGTSATRIPRTPSAAASAASSEQGTIPPVTYPGRSMPTPRPAALVLFVLVSLVISSCTSAGERAPTTSASDSDAPTSTGPEIPDLRMRLVQVSGKGADGPFRPADVDEAAEAIREDLEDLYVTAF